MFLPGLFEASLRMTGQSRLKDIRVKPEYDWVKLNMTKKLFLLVLA